MRSIRIPATSANMGPGFDCMGIALCQYNTISFAFMESGLQIDLEQHDKARIPADARNLVYRVFCRTLQQYGIIPPGVHFSQINHIPPVRGLGSSAACVVGGVAMANAYMGEKLSVQEIINLCAAEDGHPDNILPAILGGIAVGCMEGGHVYYDRFEGPENLRCAVFVPPFQLPTKKARAALPKSVPMQDAIFNISRTAMQAAAFAHGNLEILRVTMQDRLHQPYRKPLIAGYDAVMNIALEHGALAACLSGAGPTVIAFLDGDNDTYVSACKNALAAAHLRWHVELLEVDKTGYRITDV
ncbi:homoserine kinase [Christensenellaceae bacterium OttesenSCG-928-L17]|nr:homoserine kinase [Christensenellaceae bacterium OttesenSCG-928-L17]